MRKQGAKPMNAFVGRTLFRCASLTGGAAILLSGLAHAADPPVKPATKEAQAGAGVTGEGRKGQAGGGAGGGIVPITPAAVGRDGPRDQTREPPRQSAQKDARDGAESVGTKGEPKDKNTLVK